MDKRQQFLQRAWLYFYQHGFHASGVDELSAALGTTKRTLYRYFGHKDGLIAEVLRYRHQDFLQQLDTALMQKNGQQAAVAYLDFLQHWASSSTFSGCSFINASAEYSSPTHPAHQQAAEHKIAVRDCLAAHGITPPLLELIFLLGEGLIVSSQVNGFDARQFVAARQWVASFA